MFRRSLFIAIFALSLIGPAAIAEDDGIPDEIEFRALVEAEYVKLSEQNPRERNMRELLETVLMVRLTRALELDDAQTRKLVKSMGKHKDDLHKMKWVRGGKRVELRNALERGESEKEIQARLDELLQIDQLITDLIKASVEATNHSLSSTKAAKFYLFIEDFEEEIGDLLKRAQQKVAEENAQAYGHSGGSARR